MSDSDKKLRKQFLIGLAGIAATVAAFQVYKRLYGPNDALPGPPPSNKETGNFADMGAAGSLHEYLQELTNRYGSIGAFWWGSTRVAYITSQKILLDEENKKLFANLSDRPPFLFDGFKPLMTKHSIQYCNGPEFKIKYHDVYLAAFQKKMVTKIPVMAKLAQKHIRSWSDAIEKNNGKVVDIDISQEGMDFSSKSVIYASFGSDISEKLCDTFVGGYHGAWDEMEKRIVAGIPSDAARDAQFQSDLTKMRETVTTILKSSNTNSKNENLFLNLIAAKKKLYDTEEKILAEAMTAIIGGTHTTGLGLAWLFNYISRNLKVQQKMFDEIKHFFNVNEDIDTMDPNTISDKLKRLMYCRQVVTESLRLSSLAPWAARVNYNQDMMINPCDGTNRKIKIPKGMAFIIGQGVSLRDENVFENGNVFNPDRWSRKNLKHDKILQQSQDAMFGGLGGRMCPGWTFFRTEALIFIVAAISKFKFEIKNDKPVKTVYGLVAHPKDNVVIKVSKR